MITNLRDQLVRDEGEVLHVYLDSRGIRTGGVGHNLEAHGIDWPVGTTITQEQSDSWLDSDISTAMSNLEANLPWTAQLDDVRRGVLLNMVFNMGIAGLLAFHRTLTYIEDGNYLWASRNMLKSLWATQVGDRAQRLANQMEYGTWT